MMRAKLSTEGDSMRRKTIGCFLAALMLTISAWAQAPTPGSSPFSPASVRVPVVSIIECGEGYTSHELYDAKITLLEVVRGEKAWERIKAASMSNERPNVGFEYILARIRFEYSARGLPGNCGHELKGNEFTALSVSGKKYETPSVVVPKPELSGRLHSGDSLEGWLLFLVAQDDSKPLMAFTADPTGAVQHGGNIWFQLYPPP
jgi:hypothetical protein